MRQIKSFTKHSLRAKEIDKMICSSQLKLKLTWTGLLILLKMIKKNMTKSNK